MPGDYILSLNGTAMKTKKELIEAITCCDGAELVFEVERKGEQTAVKVSPVETQQGVYKVGIWVRDDLQGLGTITYVKGDSFGALGHSINDSDTGTLLQVSGGDIYAADIFGVEKGSAGSPGEIEGVISYQTENVVGQIEENRTYGIYGSVTESFLQELSLEAVEVADSREVECGTAWIQSDVTGTLSQYEIEIVNVHKNEQGDPELEFLVTDAELIAETGGIIQGMSGSPILQNGKLVGAVTHVFVEEPTRGYGIFAASMLENTD
jgi:stage IV sporulation protein B